MRQKSFTFVELLIVVAIIGILSVVAVPNFMMALMRARIAKVNAEVNTLKNAIESYRIEYGVYPMDGNDYPKSQLDRFHQKTLQKSLTTPFSYLSEVLVDPFNTKEYVDGNLLFDIPPHPYLYFTVSGYEKHGGNANEYSIFSYAPDQDFDNASSSRDSVIQYHSSNGLKSDGDIGIFGP